VSWPPLPRPENSSPDPRQLAEEIRRGMGPTINASGGSSSEIMWARERALKALDSLVDALDEARKQRDACMEAAAAKPPSPQVVDAITRQTISDLMAERDRLAGEWEQEKLRAELFSEELENVRGKHDRLAETLRDIADGDVRIHYVRIARAALASIEEG